MKNRTLFYLLLTPLLVALTACPVETKVPLGSKATEKIDPALLGSWKLQEFNENAEIQEFEVTNNDEFTLHIFLAETGALYDGEESYDGFVTKIDGKKFIYFESTIGTYYLYSYQLKDKVLTTYEIALENADVIKTTQDLRTRVSAAIKKGTGLGESVNWVKTE
jgi:hypothetical protein